MEENRPEKCIVWVEMTGVGESGAGTGDENTGIDKGETGMDRKDTRIDGRRVDCLGKGMEIVMRMEAGMVEREQGGMSEW